MYYACFGAMRREGSGVAISKHPLLHVPYPRAYMIVIKRFFRVSYLTQVFFFCVLVVVFMASTVKHEKIQELDKLSDVIFWKGT